MAVNHSKTSNTKRFSYLLIAVGSLSIIIALYGQQLSKDSIQNTEQKAEWLLELENSLDDKSHWQRVVALRHFAHKTYNKGHSSFYMDFKTVDTIALPKLYEAFQHDFGAVMCEGVSLYLNKLCNEFGYRSWSYDVGEIYKGKGGASHQFNIVEIEFEGDTIITVHDPYFDHSYVNKKSKPIDFFSILQMLSQEQADSIFIKAHENRVLVDYLLGNNRFQNNNLYNNLLKSYKITFPGRLVPTNNPLSFWKIKIDQSLNAFMRRSGGKYKKFLQRKGYPSEFIYLLLFPKTVIGPQQEKMRAKIDSIIKVTGT